MAKENNHEEAIAAFERSKQLDANLAQAAEFQIGIALIKDITLTKRITGLS